MTDTAPPVLSASEPLVDRYRRLTPKWYPWMKQVFESLRGAHGKIAEVETGLGTVTATVSDVTSDLHTVQLNVATLQDTSTTQGLAITQLQTLSDDFSAQWAVKITSGGQVIGLAQLDGSAEESTFTIVADHFLVAHPTISGTTIQAFGIGLVDGVSTVGINGDLIIDGSIVARHLSVDTLDAITADLGTITAGKLQSADGNMVIDLDAKSIVITA